jgi:hypothetical protein
MYRTGICWLMRSDEMVAVVVLTVQDDRSFPHWDVGCFASLSTSRLGSAIPAEIAESKQTGCVENLATKRKVDSFRLSP